MKYIVDVGLLPDGVDLDEFIELLKKDKPFKIKGMKKPLKLSRKQINQVLK